MLIKTIKVMSKQQCLEIAKIVNFDKTKTDEEHLVFLPNEVFGETHNLDYIDGDFVIHDNKGELRIPCYFVKTAQNFRI